MKFELIVDLAADGPRPSPLPSMDAVRNSFVEVGRVIASIPPGSILSRTVSRTRAWCTWVAAGDRPKFVPELFASPTQRRVHGRPCSERDDSKAAT